MREQRRAARHGKVSWEPRLTAGQQGNALTKKGAVPPYPSRSGDATQSQRTIRCLPDKSSGMQQIKGNSEIETRGSGSGRNMARLQNSNIAQARTREGLEPKRMPPGRLPVAQSHRAPCTAASLLVTDAGISADHGTGSQSPHVGERLCPGL